MNFVQIAVRRTPRPTEDILSRTLQFVYMALCQRKLQSVEMLRVLG